MSDNEELEQAKHMIRYLALAWREADEWIWKHAGHLDEIMQYPIVQGTGHQIKLKRISEQQYDPAEVHAAVKMMLPDQPDIEESIH